MSELAKKINELKFKYATSEFRILVPVILFLLVCGIVAVSFSFCTKTDIVLRSLAPKDTIIYLETNDLGKTLDALTENNSFKELSSENPDFSGFSGIQVAVAVTGFETRENQVTDQQSVLNFKPKFTAIAETHGWSWQVASLVENNLNNFVRKNYGSDAKLERKSVNDTERFVWTANDGRKTFAVISGTQVFFGNDEESLNKCLLAKRGEAENLLKNESLSFEYEKAQGKLAFGFVSKEGIRQIADLVGVTVAVGQSEDENARGFISGILPQILNKSVKEITWTANKSAKGIEDEIFIRTEKEVSDILSETLVSSNTNADEIYKFLPPETFSATVYNLKNPQIAFRSLLLTTAKQTDAVNGKIIAAFSNSLLGSYGIADAEGFLSAVESSILTARLDENGDKKFSIVKVKDFEKIKQTIVEDIDFSKEPVTIGKDGKLWNAENEDLAVVLVENFLIIGDKESVKTSVNGKTSVEISPSALFSQLKENKSVAATFTKDTETAVNMANVFGKTKENQKITSYNLTQTNFNKQGIERKYISDFGFLGTIVEQFDGK